MTWDEIFGHPVHVRHFEPEEFVKDPTKIHEDVVLLLDEMRDAAGVPFVIHVGWDDAGHVKDSGHYAGERDKAVAVDFHMVGKTLMEQWILAELFPWTGIGLYPYWARPGLHVDLRRIGREHPSMGRRWWRDKAQAYQPLTAGFIKSLVTGSEDV